METFLHAFFTDRGIRINLKNKVVEIDNVGFCNRLVLVFTSVSFHNQHWYMSHSKQNPCLSVFVAFGGNDVIKLQTFSPWMKSPIVIALFMLDLGFVYPQSLKRY